MCTCAETTPAQSEICTGSDCFCVAAPLDSSRWARSRSGSPLSSVTAAKPATAARAALTTPSTRRSTGRRAKDRIIAASIARASGVPAASHTRPMISLVA